MLRQSEGAPGARIRAFGHYQPPNVVTNDDLTRTVDISADWIRSRVGVEQRRLAGPDESVIDMATHAGSKAIAASGLAPRDIDLVIVATCTQETQIPNASAPVASRLGLGGPGAYDVNAACAGFCYALTNASDAIRAGTATNVLVIGVEKLSAWLDWTDPNTCVIFGDGAGAAVVSPAATTGIGPVVWGSAGHDADKILIKDRQSFVAHEGQVVYRWAITKLAPVARAACERAGVAPDDLAAFIPHQANLRIIEAIAKKVNAPDAVVARDIVDTGNTSAASIPLALSRMIERGEIPSDAPALLIGFGAGLTYAAQVIHTP